MPSDIFPISELVAFGEDVEAWARLISGSAGVKMAGIDSERTEVSERFQEPPYYKIQIDDDGAEDAGKESFGKGHGKRLNPFAEAR